MSKNSKAHKRGSSRTKRAHSRRRRTHRRRGGADALDGAPLKYHLAGSWPSRMSLGQGADYFKYHVGQHGGMNSDANIGGAPLRAISHSMLPANLQMAAHTRGTLDALDYASKFTDQAGGRSRRRSRHCKKHGKRHGKKHCKSRRHRRRTHRKRGGNMGYAPFPNKGMLLDSPSAYSQAGLNPQWKTDPAFDAAKVRSQQ